jgi:hypothetical protein
MERWNEEIRMIVPALQGTRGTREPRRRSVAPRKATKESRLYKAVRFSCNYLEFSLYFIAQLKSAVDTNCGGVISKQELYTLVKDIVYLRS